MKEQLHEQISSILHDLNFPPIDINFERPKVDAHGDLTTNAAMILAKSVGKNPRQIAQSIVDKIAVDPSFLAAVEIAGPGFINFKLSDSYVIEQSKKILQEGNAFGKTGVGGKRKTNIEWVSANPTGPLHSGHGRQVILGKVIANLLEWTGHDVTREYYFNNAGNQMRNLAESIYAR